MFNFILVLSIFSCVVNLSQGQGVINPRPTNLTTTTKKIITSFEPTTVTEPIPVTTITVPTETVTEPVTETTAETTDTESPPTHSETETTTTYTEPPPIGTNTTPKPTFRSTTPPTSTPYRHSTYLPSTIYPPTTFPKCCGHNEFSHYTYAGVPKWCDPVCKDLAKECEEVYSAGTWDCYCIPGYCRVKNNVGKGSPRCVKISDIVDHCYRW